VCEDLDIEATADLLFYDAEVLFFLGELLFEGADACLGGEDVMNESRFEGLKGGEFFIGEWFGGGHDGLLLLPRGTVKMFEWRKLGIPGSPGMWNGLL